jgi:hypothetical protein
MNWFEPRRMADRSGLLRVAFGDHRVGGGNGMAGGRLGRVRGTASAGLFPMGTAAGAPQRLTKLYLGNCARTEEAGSRSRRKRKDSHDLLEVVVELESVTEQLRHRYLVCRLPLAFAHLDPELPGAQGADADVYHLFVSLEVVPSAGWVLPDPKNPRIPGRRQHPPIALPQEGVGPPGGHGGLAQHPRARYGLPCPVVALPLALPADCLTPGA